MVRFVTLTLPSFKFVVLVKVILLFLLMKVLLASLSDDITNGAATKGERIPPKEYKKCRVLNKPGPSDPQMTTRPAFPPVDKSIARYLQEVIHVVSKIVKI